MKNVKALLSLKIVNFKECRQCLLNKNIIALLIVFCRGVNVFVPKNVNINKNRLVSVLALSTHNAVIDIFKRCNDSLIIISSKIDLQIFLFQRSTNSREKSAQKNSQSNPNKDGTTNNSVVIINGTSNNNKVKKIFFDNYFRLCFYMFCKVI
ncbi:MAG: hypothetical protein LBC22_05425 [Endomicrobium sp.]|jgi:hypothetical protein|nr:hypothetical protein [Endomicrobium sp.]